MEACIVRAVLDTAVVIAGVLLFLPSMGVPGLAHLVAWLLLFAYAAIGFFPVLPAAKVHGVKLLLLCALLCCTVGYRTVSLIGLRLEGKQAIFSVVHDHPLQNEASVAMLLDGRNPYREDFRTTQLVQWMGPGNPSITHVIALPVTLYKSVPFFVFWHWAFGWYDDRISHLVLFGLLCAGLYALPKTKELKLTLVAAAAFHPLFAPFFAEGRSDVIFLAFLVLALTQLQRGHAEESLLLLALSMGSKHTAVFAAPFFLLYLWRHGWFAASKRHFVIAPGVLLLLIFLPFILWDALAFFQDVVAYPAGTLSTSYPINGYGLSRILVALGVVPHLRSAFPLAPFLVLLLPLLGALLYHLWRKPTLGNLVACYVAILCPFWFVSRFFNNNYLGVVITLVIIAAVLLHEERNAPQRVGHT